MNGGLARTAGSAFLWKGIQHAGVTAIYFARVLVLAWLLAPDDFGLYAIALVVVDLLMQLTEFGMQPALVQHRGPSASTYRTAWTIGVLRAGAVSAGVLLAAPLVTRLFGEPAVLPLVQVLALRPLLDALASARVAERMRELDFRALALIRVPEALVNAGTSIVLAPRLGVWCLVAGTLAGSGSRAILSYAVAPWRPGFGLDRADAGALIRFGRWIFVAGLVTVAGSFALRAIVTRTLGAAELGLYFLAARLAFMPATVVSEIVGAVAFPLFARVRDQGDRLARAFRLIVVGTSALLVPACAVIAVLAPAIVGQLLDERWAGTVPLVRLLAVAAAIGIFGEAVVPLLHGTGRPRDVALLELVQTSTLIAVLVAAIGRLGLDAAALAWIPAAVVSQALAVVLVRRQLRRPLAGLGAPALAIVAAAAVSAGAAWLVARAVPGPGGLAGALAAAGAIGAATLWGIDATGRVGLRAGLGELFPWLPRIGRGA